MTYHVPSISIEALVGLPEKDAEWNTTSRELRIGIRGPSLARERAQAAFAAQAKMTAIREIKYRARSYAKRPRELAAFGCDLIALSPNNLVSALEYIARNPSTYRWFGFGGEVPAINLRGARIYARYLRAKKQQLSKRAKK